MGGSQSKRRGRPSPATPHRGTTTSHSAAALPVPSTTAGAVGVASPLLQQPQVRQAAVAAAASAAAASSGLLTPEAPIALVVLAHHHTVYCDRKRVVCTAEGAVREGNRLGIVIPDCGIAAPTGAHARYAQMPDGMRVTWYSSGGVDGGGPRGDKEHPSSVTVGDRTLWPVPRRTLQEVLPHYVRAAPTLTNLPDDGAAAVAAAVTYADAVSASAHAPSESPLFTSSGAMRLLQAEACLSTADELQYHLTAADAGHLICAVVSTAGKDKRPLLLTSPPRGPVESAPPRIRELWIEGDAVVGGRLTARAIYWGGKPGPCLWSWILVDAEGGRTETEPREAPAGFASDEGGEVMGDSDPRVWRLTGAGLVGCSLKVTCEPVRVDGVRGAPTTSRPTRDVEVAAAPDVVEPAAGVAAVFSPAPAAAADKVTLQVPDVPTLRSESTPIGTAASEGPMVHA